MAIVYKTRNRKRARAHGFLARKNSPTGKNILVRRRQKGRKKIVNI
ncbi:MAG: 50S ribosomal protein L34 [Candidatus Paceibacterota bacterium]